MDINRSGSSGNLARAASLDSRGAGPSEPSARPLGGKRTAAEALLPAPGRQPASALRTSAAPAIGTLAALQSFLNASAPAPLSHENAQRLLINEEAHAANMAGLGAMLAEPASHDEVMDVMVSPPFPSEMPGELADLALLQYEGLRGEMGAAIAASPTGAPLHAADLTHLLDTVFEEPLPNEPRLDGTSLANVFDELAEPAAALPPLPPPPPVPHQVAPVNFGELGADMQDVVLQAMHQGRAEHAAANGVAFEAFLQDAADPFNIDVGEGLPLASQQHLDMPVPLPVHVYVPIPLPDAPVALRTDAEMEALFANAVAQPDLVPQPLAAPLPQDAPARLSTLDEEMDVMVPPPSPGEMPGELDELDELADLAQPQAAPARLSTPELMQHMSPNGLPKVCASVQKALADQDVQNRLAAQGIALHELGAVPPDGGENLGRRRTLTPLLEEGIRKAQDATDPSTAPMAAAQLMAYKISEVLRAVPGYNSAGERLETSDGTPRNLAQVELGFARRRHLPFHDEASAINALASGVSAAVNQPRLSPNQQEQLLTKPLSSVLVFQKKLDDMITEMGDRGKQAAAFISVAVPLHESAERQYVDRTLKAQNRLSLLEAIRQWPDSLEEMITAANIDIADPRGAALQQVCTGLHQKAQDARKAEQGYFGTGAAKETLRRNVSRLGEVLNELQTHDAHGTNPVLDWLRNQPLPPAGP